MKTSHIGRRIGAIASHLELKHSILSKLMRHTTDPSGCRSKAPAPAGPGLLFEAPSYSTWYTSSCKEEIDVCENPHNQPEISQYYDVQCFSFQNGYLPVHPWRKLSEYQFRELLSPILSLYEMHIMELYVKIHLLACSIYHWNKKQNSPKPFVILP